MLHMVMSIYKSLFASVVWRVCLPCSTVNFSCMKVNYVEMYIISLSVTYKAEEKGKNILNLSFSFLRCWMIFWCWGRLYISKYRNITVHTEFTVPKGLCWSLQCLWHFFVHCTLRLPWMHVEAWWDVVWDIIYREIVWLTTKHVKQNKELSVVWGLSVGRSSAALHFFSRLLSRGISQTHEH